jgi:hypothetical protein
MKYATVMGSDAMIHIPSFTKIGSGIQKLIGWTHQSMVIFRYTFFFQNKESGLKSTYTIRFV